jgi:hypothetical protein
VLRRDSYCPLGMCVASRKETVRLEVRFPSCLYFSFSLALNSSEITLCMRDRHCIQCLVLACVVAADAVVFVRAQCIGFNVGQPHYELFHSDMKIER